MVLRWFIAAAAALGLMLGTAVAQDKPQKEEQPQQASSGIDTKTLLENEQMRVMEMRFKPGAKTSTLSHPNRFVYALADGALVFSPAGKTPYELSFKRGEALWLPADSMAAQNDTDKDVRVLVVELRGGVSHAASSSKGSGKGKHTGKARGKKGSGGKGGRKAAAK